MALLNSHPDYMRFDGGRPSDMQYPVERYIEFLEYVKSRYAGRFHTALPLKSLNLQTPLPSPGLFKSVRQHPRCLRKTRWHF